MRKIASLGRVGRTGLIVAVLVALLVVAGCARSAEVTSASSKASGDSSNYLSSGNSPPTSAVPSATVAGSGNNATSFNADAEQDPMAETPTDQPPGADGGRSVVSSATMTVDVVDVMAAKDEAASIVSSHGGYVFGEESTFGETSSSLLTLKVPPANFRKVLAELASLGALSSEQVKTDDVTQQVVDLDARIAATTDSLERTRGLLANAKTLPEIQQLENEVVRRQTDLESLRGQQKTLQAKVAFSTITVTIAGAADTTPAVEQERAAAERKQQEERATPGFTDGLGTGLGVAATVGSILLAILGLLLPFTPVILLVVGVMVFRRRRARALAEAQVAREAADSDVIEAPATSGTGPIAWPPAPARTDGRTKAGASGTHGGNGKQPVGVGGPPVDDVIRRP